MHLSRDMKRRSETKLQLTEEEKPILKHLRRAFREVAGKADGGRIGKLTVLAFRLEFPNSKTENMLGNAYVRSIPPLRKMLADEGGSISAAEAAARLGVSRATVLRKYREQRLLGWRDYYAGDLNFPLWQFDNEGLLPGLEEVMKVLRSDAPVEDIGRILFFVSWYHSLDGQRPLDCLRQGNVEAAVRTAQAYVS